MGRYALRTWLHRHHLQALSTRPHRPRTTVADPAATVTENRLLGQPAPTAPNQVWVGDITYLPLVGGRWLPGHLARCLLPAGGGRVPGRSDADRIGAPRPGKGLDTAPTGPGLMVHADRGSQYTSAACRARVAQAGALPSFSRPGNPYDNAYWVRPRPRLEHA